jgi:type IV secretory pathway TrbF-like protein
LTRPENVKILNHAWQTAFNRTNGQAKADLAVYIEAENPLKHPEKRMMVEVTPMLVHRLGQGNSYRVDWAEEWKEGGRLIRKSRWSGTFTVEIKLDQKPTINGQTKAVLRASTNELAPMGLYISTYKWGEELTGGSY